MPHYKNLEKIVQKAGIKTTSVFRDTINQQPNYPSMECLVNILDELKISNLSVKLQAEQLAKINFPAIAHLQKDEDSYFVFLQSINNEEINFYDTDKGMQTLSIAEFNKTWSGKIILLSIDKNSVEPKYEENLKKERFQTIEKSIVYLIISSLFFVGLYLGQTWYDKTLWVLYGAGAAISVLLLLNEFGENNEVIQKLCGLTSHSVQNSTGCDAVTNSKASKVFGWLSWSEIGLFYFFGSLLLLVTSSVSPSARLLSFIHLGSLVYVFWSVYHQWRVVKQWCLLCLLVQGISVLIFVTFLLSGVYKEINGVQLRDFYTLAITFSLPVGLWFIIKSKWLESKNALTIEKELMSWTKNFDLFETLLQKQPCTKIGHFTKEITIGNPEAPILLTMVSNPFCNPCADAHKEVKALVEYFGDELQVIIRFVGNSSDGEQIINHFYSLEDTNEREKVVEEWYKTKDLKLWAITYPNYKELPQLTATKESKKWLESVNIEFTPTFFINGKKLKQPYNIYNLKYFIRNLAIS